MEATNEDVGSDAKASSGFSRDSDIGAGESAITEFAWSDHGPSDSATRSESDVEAKAIKLTDVLMRLTRYRLEGALNRLTRSDEITNAWFDVTDESTNVNATVRRRSIGN
jgi:hypothetical protein